jgi:hypothetical protein
MGTLTQTNPGLLLAEAIRVLVAAVVLLQQGTQAAINSLELSCRPFN